jgi:hypothetical protein
MAIVDYEYKACVNVRVYVKRTLMSFIVCSNDLSKAETCSQISDLRTGISMYTT